MRRTSFALTFVFAITPLAFAQTPVYAPLATWKDELALWEARRVTLTSSSEIKPTARPSMPGLLPANVELLQDALLRKFPTLLRRNASMARRLIERRFHAGVNGRNQLNGAMAEALFLHKNPEWGYVSTPNASQHDVYRRIAGRRPPMNGQIKFHSSGDPATYARDMISDFRAHRFFVPDDHVVALREFWLNAYNEAKKRSDLALANFAARNAGRVQGIGSTSNEILAGTREAFQVSSAESRALYVSLGAGVALSVGQIGWDYAHGRISGDQATYQAVRYATLIGAGVGVDTSLTILKQGAIRGTFKGNMIVGSAMLMVDTSWSIYEHGGLANAFRRPDFYEQLGGSASGLGLGIAATAYVGASTSEFGPWVAVPSGVVAGTVVSATAYVGGRSATSWLVRSLRPDLYQQIEQQQIDIARRLLTHQLGESQAFK